MPEQHSGERGQSMDYKLVISEHADKFHSAEMLIWRIGAITKQLFHRWITLSFLM